jgi:two-component system chemotaxis response regulator CheY
MGGRVLIVHAASVVRMMIKNSLTSNGYDVVGEAADGRAAIEQYRALRPDLVTMDMVMPDMDGTAAVKAILAEFPRAIIVICTSASEPAILAAALDAGAKSYITKPFGPDRLVNVIRRVSA